MSLFNRVPRAARLTSLLTSVLLALGSVVALAAYGPARSPRAASAAVVQRLDTFARARAAGVEGGGRGASPTALQASGKIAFVSDRSGGQRDIFVMSPDGSGQTNVSNNQAFDGEPAFSPDGAKIVFLSDRDGNDEVYVMNADGTNQTRLTSNADFDNEPAFSPDGGKIVFTSGSEIYVMNADGSGPVNLTNHPALDGDASFSPDGSKIVFVSTRDGGDGEVYVMNADGTNQTRLTTDSGFDPSFSPDGSKITFTGSDGMGASVALMNADGTNQTLLANPASGGNPTFSPDGTRIAFESFRDGDEEIYVMNADGSAQTRLSNDGGEDTSPAWQTVLACAPPPPNGVAWYRAEGGANDSIGTNQGTLQNGATFAPGFVGQAFSFDGADDFVEVPNSAAVSPETALTVAAWIKTSGANGRIVDKITAATSSGYLLDVSSGKLRLTVGAAVVSSAQSLPLDTFVHVAGTYDGAAARIYINGEPAGSFAGGGAIQTNSEPLRIGIASDGTGPFTGLVDEVDIFGRALSAAEVKDIYDAKSAGKCLATPAQSIAASNTNDSGPGSLRQAILDANAQAGVQTITFNLPGPGVRTISPASALPPITDEVVIDGYTQPGSSPNTLSAGSDAVLLVELDGAGAGAGASGLDITAGNSTVRGLVINRFAQQGVRLASADGNTVEGNFIGTDAAASGGLGNGGGVLIEADSAGNTIGGTTPAARNVIAANQLDNVKITGSTSNSIRGNYVGTNAAGTTALAGIVGVRLDNAASGNSVGGTSAGARNLISGHGNTGVLVTGGSASNTVEGNYIGTNFDGTSAVANALDGVELDATANTVGGTAAGAGNLIAFNGRSGVRVSAGASSAVLGNSFHSNGTLGIDLGGDDAVTVNDAVDEDAGANNLQNFPVLTSVSSGDGTTTVTGTLNSTPTTSFRIEFFTNPSCDASGHGEGKTFIGSASVRTDASGNSPINAALSGTVAAGVSVTATATSGGEGSDTSEFSSCRQPDAGPGALAFAAARFEADEKEVTATIRVVRTGGSDGAVSVDYAARGGTASAPADYAPAAGTLSFAAGQASKTFTVTLVNDSTFEQEKTVQLSLSNPTGGATVGAQASSTLFITDDEGTFTNSARITISDTAPAAPYPSTINVSGLPANVDKALVKLHGLSHTYLSDVEVLLVGPAGQKIVLMSAEGGGEEVTDLTLAFEDAASQSISEFVLPASGRYRPSTNAPADPPAPAPAGPYGNSLAPAAGADPNGTWSLYVHDSAGGDMGQISGGWSMTFSPLPPTTFNLGGRIVEGASGLSGVTVTLSGSQSATTTTDDGGSYTFAGVAAGGNYTVTATLTNYTFAPPSRTFNSLAADQAADFTATRNIHAIGGRVADAGNNSLAGVLLTLGGSQSATTASDAGGNYSFAHLPAGGNYTVTVLLANYAFNPPSLSFNSLATDRTADFVGTLDSHNITGRVGDDDNNPVSGVTVTLAGAQGATTQTDARGDYSFANLAAGGSYTVVASLANYTFAPSSRAFNNLSSDQAGYFTATLDTHTISGRVVDTVNAPLAGVAVSLGGSARRAAQTDAQGNYSFTAVPAGGSYTVTPALAGYAFTPPSLAFAGLGADAAANFTARISVATPAGTNVSITTAAATLTFAQVSSAGMTTVVPADPAAPVVPPQGYSFPPGAPSLDITTTATTSGLITVCLSVPAATDPTVFAGLRLLHGEGGALVDRTSSSDFASKTICALTASLSPFVVAFAQPVTIRGRAADPQGGPLAGVVVTLSGAQSAQTTTDAGGNYSFANLPATQNYVVTPAKVNLTFAPPAHTFERIAGNATANFVGSGALTIRGRVSSPTIDGVTVTLSGTRSAVATVGPNGEFAFDKLPRGGTYKVKAQGGSLSFTPSEREFANLLDDAWADFDAVPLANPTPTPPVADDFSGGARDPQKFAEGTLTQPAGSTDPLVIVEQKDGKLVITPRPDFTGPSFNGYVAVAAVDFTNATASIQADQIATGGAQTIFSVGSDDQNFFRFVAQEAETTASASSSAGGAKARAAASNTLRQLLLQVRNAGVFNSLAIPYDPVTHKFWRFRHDAAASPVPAMLFEVSPTGLNGTWAAVRIVPVAGAIGSLATEISVGTMTAVNSPGQAVFDNLNLVPDQTVRRAGEYRLSTESLTVAEGAGSFTVRVARSGASLKDSTVEVASEPSDGKSCATADGKARARCDYTTTFARLRFAPGETEKAVTVFVTDDSYAEGAEAFRLALGNPSVGFSVESPVATVTVVDDDQPGARNPIDSAGFFVRQQYLDFLGREPDAGGFAAWTGVLRGCAFEGHFGPGKSGSDANCDRITVSSGFYRSSEFHERGYFAYRFYEVALGRRPTYDEFLSDMHRLSGPQVEVELEANRAAFAKEFMVRGASTGRQSFRDINGNLDTAAALDRMLARAGLTLTSRDRLAADLVAGRVTPEQALRAVAESNEASAKFYNRAFVTMQYFGYLQRDPDEAGFQSWLNHLNANPQDFRTMIFGFLYSQEYQSRFGPVR